jgi:hypothetical protein
MNSRQNLLTLLLVSSIIFVSCKKDDPDPDPAPAVPSLVFRFVFDSTQVRLNNVGQPSSLPANHGAQSPKFNKMSAHYIELAPTPFTLLGEGEVVFHNQETTQGGATAIDFSKSFPVGNNEVFYQVPLKDLTPGTYQWLRVSLAYQNYDIKFRFNYLGTNFDMMGTVASFIGYNTYVSSYKVKDSTITLNENKLQGYWAFETVFNVSQGQAPPGATTVPNPLFNSSPIPQGSCVVTGAFETPLVITGNETHHKVVTVSLSTNKSFEWQENSTPGFYEPAAGDVVVDMGIRGMRVKVE